MRAFLVKYICISARLQALSSKVNYSYWTKIVSDIISRLGCNSDSPIREIKIYKDRTEVKKFLFLISFTFF